MTKAKRKASGASDNYISVTYTYGPPHCRHANGTYSSIPARFLGRRQVFVCRDCESVLDAKTKQRV